MEKEFFADEKYVNYPDQLVGSSMKIEGPVCALLMTEMSLIDDAGLTQDDFITKDGRFLFTLCQYLRNKSVVKLDEITLTTNCNPKLLERINELGGWRKLQKMMSVVNIDNWDMILDRLKKRNVMIELHDRNFNLFQSMRITKRDKTVVEVVPFDFFEKNNYTSSEVLDFYDGVVAEIGTSVHSSKIVEGGYVSFDDNWLNSLRDKSEVGVSFADAGYDVNGDLINLFPFMNKQICGLLPGTLNAWGAPSGVGKSTYMVSVLMALASQGKRTIVVTNEMQLKQYKVMFLLFILTRHLKYWKVTKSKLTSGSWSDDDAIMIKEAQKIWDEKYAKMIRVEVLADADSGLTCQIFKKWILRNACEVFLIDTFKLSMTDNLKDNGWVSIVKDTRDLAALAARYKVIGLMTVQLALGTVNRSFLDASCLSNCKAMKEVMTNLIMFRNVVPEELDPTSEYYMHPFRSKQKEDGTWYEEAFEPDPTEVWRVAFIDKTRQGEDSKARGVAYLWKFDGEHGKFSETCKCRPCRKILPGY